MNKLSEYPIPSSQAVNSSLLPAFEHSQFRKLSGRIQWVLYKSRPDLCFAAWLLSKRVASPSWIDLAAMNKLIRAAKYTKCFGLRFVPMAKGRCRVVGMVDGAFNQCKVEPSCFGGSFGLTDDATEEEFDQSLYIAPPNAAGMPAASSTQTKAIQVGLLYWRVREVQRRVDTILDVETLSVQWGSNVCKFLTSLILELQLTIDKRRPLLFNDSDGLITHLKSTNKHSNMRLNVIFSTLRDSYTRNEFMLRWLCGKTMNLADILTKLKSAMLEPFRKAVRLCKWLVPRW